MKNKIYRSFFNIPSGMLFLHGDAPAHTPPVPAHIPLHACAPALHACAPTLPCRRNYPFVLAQIPVRAGANTHSRKRMYPSALAHVSICAGAYTLPRNGMRFLAPLGMTPPFNAVVVNSSAASPPMNLPYFFPHHARICRGNPCGCPSGWRPSGWRPSDGVRRMASVGWTPVGWAPARGAPTFATEMAPPHSQIFIH